MGLASRGVLLVEVVMNSGKGECGGIGFKLGIELFGEVRQFCEHGTGLCTDMS